MSDSKHRKLASKFLLVFILTLLLLGLITYGETRTQPLLSTLIINQSINTSAFVPYIGALFNVDLNFHNITGLHWIEGNGSLSDGNINRTITSIITGSVPTVYLPINISLIYGTYDEGNLFSILIADDGNSYNVTEAAGVNAFEVVINFTNVDSFNQILLRVWVDGSEGHSVIIGLYDCVSGLYEEEYSSYSDTSYFVYVPRDVFDASDHICDGGNVSLRLRLEQNGNINHHHYIDYAVIVDSISSGTYMAHDSTSGRNLESNHPQYTLLENEVRNFTINSTFTAEAVCTGDVCLRRNSTHWCLGVDCPV